MPVSLKIFINLALEEFKNATVKSRKANLLSVTTLN